MQTDHTSLLSQCRALGHLAGISLSPPLSLGLTTCISFSAASHLSQCPPTPLP